MTDGKPYNSLKAAWVLLFSFVMFFSPAQAQDDSLKIYRKIKKAAYKYRLTRMAYDAVFVDPEPKEYPKEPASREEKHVNPYLLFPGKIIRRINIEVLDPFGYSVNDTAKKKVNGVQQLGNHFHITTRQWIIRNRLLFDETDSINPLALSESERILREAVFVNDARVFISPTPSRDSIDVNVIVLDKWPVVVPLMVTDVSGNARFRNTNLFGSGQQFEHYLGFRRPDVVDFNGYYNIGNLDRTFISSRLGYEWNRDVTGLSLTFDRPFYSPLAKWAGGLGLNHWWRTYTHLDTIEGISHKLPVNLFNYDAWVGKNFKLSTSGSLFNQSTNLVAGLRHYRYTFVNRPSFAIDTARSNRNWGAIIGNAGFAIQQYYKDRFIHRFGANEDVPEGLIVQFIYGGLKREFGKMRIYHGIELARAKHFDFGYLSATFSYGIFYNKGVPNDITTNYQLYYFSDLVRAGRWYLRQFLNYNLVHGDNKIGGETVTLRPEDLYGFTNGSLTGNTKMVLNSETVAYMPYSLIGFRFAPVAMVGLGMIGDKANPLSKSLLYQGYSLGVMVRNENLLSSTFQISVGYYPFLPDGRAHVLVYNPVTSFTLRVRGFSVNRPEFVAY